MKPIHWAILATVAIGAYFLWSRNKNGVQNVKAKGVPRAMERISPVLGSMVAANAKARDNGVISPTPAPPPAVKAATKAEARSNSFYETYLKKLDPTRKENALANLADKSTGGIFGEVSSVLGALGRFA